MSKKILIVDDADQYRSMLLEFLQNEPYELFQAKDGEDALNLVESKKGEIDLLLTDIVMPRMDGMTLAEKVTAKYPHVKVIYSSGYSQSATFHEKATTGDINFIEKPFEPADLIKLVSNVLAS
jgi:two-component system, cell cycle sensor histidine kinase and response regulator CckA